MTGLGNIDDVYRHYLEVIDKCEKLEKQLKIAVEGLKDIKSMTFERYLMANGWGAVNQMRKHAQKALEQIKELD